MSYAIIDLADSNKVALVSEKKYPFLGIEEEWFEEGEENPPLPPGWPEKYYPVSLYADEAEKITAALEAGKTVHIDRNGYVSVGQEAEQEQFWLKQVQLAIQELGGICDHILWAKGEITRKQFQEAQEFRKKEVQKILSQ